MNSDTEDEIVTALLGDIFPKLRDSDDIKTQIETVNSIKKTLGFIFKFRCVSETHALTEENAYKNLISDFNKVFESINEMLPEVHSSKNTPLPSGHVLEERKTYLRKDTSEFYRLSKMEKVNEENSIKSKSETMFTALCLKLPDPSISGTKATRSTLRQKRYSKMFTIL